MAVVAHGAFSVWWASKINTQVISLNVNLNRIYSELEKRDAQIQALWKRMDDIKDMMINGTTKRHI